MQKHGPNILSSTRAEVKMCLLVFGIFDHLVIHFIKVHSLFIINVVFDVVTNFIVAIILINLIVLAKLLLFTVELLFVAASLLLFPTNKAILIEAVIMLLELECKRNTCMKTHLSSVLLCPPLQ